MFSGNAGTRWYWYGLLPSEVLHIMVLYQSCHSWYFFSCTVVEWTHNTRYEILIDTLPVMWLNVYSVVFLGRSRGVPNRLMAANNHARHISDHSILDVDSAIQQFENLGGHITTFHSFGEDPLKSNSQLVTRREAEFQARYPDFVNGNFSLFREGVLFLIRLSRQLQASM